MMREREIKSKITEVINYLKEHDGYEYKLYNHICPDEGIEPDSNIVEYAEDVAIMIEEIFKELNDYYEKYDNYIF